MSDRFGAPRPSLTPGRWDPAIRAGLEAMLASEAPGIAAFDWDETCIRGDISETWLAELEAAQPTGRVDAYEAGCAADKRAAYIQLAIDLVHDRTEREVRAAVLDVAERAVRDGRIAFRPEIRELIWALQRHGWAVWVVTASPTAVVQPLAETYGIHPHRVLGMQSPLSADGRYLPHLNEPATFREGKRSALTDHAGGAPTFAAGDSEGDLWMLSAARYRLLVDRGPRGDPALRARATAEGWWIQHGWT